MKKRICSLLITAMALFTSCQDDIAVTNEEPGYSNITENQYSISEESALAYLADFLADSEPDSRSGKRISVKSIKPIKYNRVASRTQQDNVDCENLLYVANFENNQGYAILAGDERISDKIIAVADTGNLDNNEIIAVLDEERAQRYIYKNYPLTGPGFFTTPETGDELFMNPNTVDLYIDSIKDTLVGNFLVDNFDEVDENGNPISTDYNILDTIPSNDLLSTSLCIDYAKNEIDREYRRRNDLEVKIGDCGGNSGGNGGSNIRTVADTSAWTIKSKVLPMLTNYAYWHQHSPFNDLYPYRRTFLCFGSKKKAPAGCFPLAIAKLLSYYHCPHILKYYGYTIDWDELNFYYNSTEGRKSAAHLLKMISEKCQSWYFKQGTFTFPDKASKAMVFFGLKNAKTYRYTWERARTMLDNGCPFIIYSVPGARINESHAWNIDGYKIKERTITYNTYTNGTLTNKRTETEILNMVHCDFGSPIKGNGYYISGVFNQKGSNYELDAGSNRGDTNYNNYIHLVMYDKP